MSEVRRNKYKSTQVEYERCIAILEDISRTCQEMLEQQLILGWTRWFTATGTSDRTSEEIDWEQRALEALRASIVPGYVNAAVVSSLDVLGQIWEKLDKPLAVPMSDRFSV